MKSFVIQSVNTYNHSLCVCGMIVYSNVGVTYGGTKIIGVVFFSFLLCLCGMFICSKVDVTLYGRSIVTLP